MVTIAMDTVGNDKSERLRQRFRISQWEQRAAVVSRPTSETVFTSFQAHNIRSRILAMRCYAAHLCPVTAVLCGPQMPDRAGAVRPTDARSRRCSAAHRCPNEPVLCGALVGPQMPDRAGAGKSGKSLRFLVEFLQFCSFFFEEEEVLSKSFRNNNNFIEPTYSCQGLGHPGSPVLFADDVYTSNGTCIRLQFRSPTDRIPISTCVFYRR
ncbi:hypothetical protein Y032_0011g1490 [Ancylostoma ceylanicum]|uniref:Uncharacterized protein n=1 Tax=Ancylostoma ceylanicum TaxID=53326 RepID=A0A016VG22_9BILA|nr:hypothetical protein Y032_0011g1490 [Ancylostoma ceylanicum]